MAVTLLALFKRPEGGPDALATFLARYHSEHLPLIARVPGLRATRVEQVTGNYAGDDLVVVTRMTFDDQPALDAAMASAEMRAAGRNLREIAPGLLTLLALGADAAEAGA
jgi:uncharacterized protein (TIGR02118 family)